ncbi:heme lyase CcmF/NrfE family subunit [Kordiimonas sp. SCSIO 12610]|uniref:heme lyase CcmF/NrfE family subunit n=1 Tax=Kordiimonas sp. SCSIO 12610 TaxID=2829597 RepID=UPI00210AD1E9|nr:heme lyase CcmF/NrfE family subunit [Kordiimonas sp. SCSIO 12610]UTW55628.1 heme lyase CcmF/NrfE family subunit [Kordiimonas sp. SCSIO 12610]
MIIEVGHFALIVALVMAAIGAVLPHVGATTHNSQLMRRSTGLVIGQFLMAAVAFASLMYSYIISDFSVLNVAANSHSLKPLLYKISGTWGNHEGSMLFWVLILTLFGAAVGFGKNLPLRFKARVLGVQSLLILGFLLFILLTSNPFERLVPAAFEGNGLNPLLQDPGLAFHPPMLYLGYVGLSVAFSFSIAALIEGEITPMWARWVRPWTLVAWIFLTGGIALGSWWAYYELGWGGWWFWDPAENASFMPWLAATALLHSAIVVEKRDALKSWTILLAIVAFSLSLLGTFLIRSGVMTSVHAFAVDPERGIFILAFLAFVIGGAFSLYAWRAPRLAPSGIFGLVSRESALVLNNILLSTFAAVVLIGTLYPLFYEAFLGSQISVGPPFFEFGTKLLMTPLIVALGVAPLLAWKRGRLSKAFQITLPAAIISLAIFVMAVWSNISGLVMTGLGLALATWLLVAIIFDITEKIQLFKKPAKSLNRLRNLPRATVGMHFAHLGLAIILFGITISEAWTSEKLAFMAPGQSEQVGPFEFTFDSVTPFAGPNYTGIRAQFSVMDNGTKIATLYPEDRVYTDPVTNTTEAGIHPLISGDLYAVIGEAGRGGKWSVRLYFKPFISGLWLGAGFMMIGGLLSLSDRRLRLGVPSAKKKTVKSNPDQAEAS